MKLFLDTADIKEIRQWAFLLDGVTTNPSHLAQYAQDPKAHIKEICQLLPHKDISVEITEVDSQKVYEQAQAIAALADNIVVKVPCQTQYFSIIQQLVAQKIRVNVTLVFSLLQATMMAKLGVSYVSPFIGRLDDIDAPGTQLLYDMRTVFDRYTYTTEMLAASIRHVGHIHEALLAGADAITIPTNVLQKAVAHPLTEQGAHVFLADWNKSRFPKFP